MGKIQTFANFFFYEIIMMTNLSHIKQGEIKRFDNEKIKWEECDR